MKIAQKLTNNKIYKIINYKINPNKIIKSQKTKLMNKNQVYKIINKKMINNKLQMNNKRIMMIKKITISCRRTVKYKLTKRIKKNYN